MPSIFADSTRYSPSSPNRETTRGWSWLHQNTAFQPPPSAIPTCQWVRMSFSARKSMGASVHLAPPG